MVLEVSRRKGKTTVAADSDHQEPLAADEKVADEFDGFDLGERQPRIGRRPYTSTKAEVEEHNPLHVHYRSWCPSCVAGRSTSKQHRRQAAYEESMGITMSVDYAFKVAEEPDDKTDRFWWHMSTRRSRSGFYRLVTKEMAQA